MKMFDSDNRDTGDDPAFHQHFKVTREIPEGLQHERKAALEKLASQGNVTCTPGPTTFHKTVHPKPPLGFKPSTDEKTENDPKPSYLNPVAQRFGVHLQATNRENYGKSECTKFPIQTSNPAKEDPKPLHSKPARNKFPNPVPPGQEKNPLGAKPNSDFATQESEEILSFPNITGIKEKLLSAAQENMPKPAPSKPPLAQKPSLDNEGSKNKDTSNKFGSLQSSLSGPRTNTYSLKKVKEMDENNSAAEAASSRLPKIALKPTGLRYSLSQDTSKNVQKETEEKGMSAAKTTVVKKIIQEAPDSSYKFCKINTALGARRSSGESKEKEVGGTSTRVLRQRVLAPASELPLSPPKPSRPPRVELERFQKSIPKKTSENEGLKQPAPLSAAFAPSVVQVNCATQFPPPPPAPLAPSLPPRNIKPVSETRNPENEENYDDVEFVSKGPGNTLGGQESDVEMYEDINDIRSLREKEKKQNKEEKRRTDQEKKEQKEKEKKELELRKKFKLMGPIEVLHQARACVDYKGGKNELTVKQGDKIEIIRVTNNPEGKWLGRIRGSYGYIKTTMVEIDYDSLKRKQQPPTGAPVTVSESDMEVYDDVGDHDSNFSLSGEQGGAGNTFPPPPSDQEIYDEIDDDNPMTSMSSSSKQPGKDCGEDVYDDVDSSHFPLPPPDPISSKPISFGKRKLAEKDVQKCKNIEREEKEFRKKFKFVGEIKVLYSTTTIQDLHQKKWGPKDLQIKPGETLDIIESTDDTKVLCRNEDGKYGYVLRRNLIQNDGDIYDDVADDCIYDNDSDA
ncbi:FYN-binding protein 1 isoform X2 [Pithys albifrons albifrons]|uniref:FYN-binding protein 1 isoform X2 n=1 Tax=Pithys albifrons albifrons TaxID=3385563 RepID=UPI003A5D03F5